MLVLTRSQNDGKTVIIKNGDAVIEVSIVGVRGDRVILGFDAPDEVKIIRLEICKNPPNPEHTR